MTAPNEKKFSTKGYKVFTTPGHNIKVAYSKSADKIIGHITLDILCTVCTLHYCTLMCSLYQRLCYFQYNNSCMLYVLLVMYNTNIHVYV